MKNQEKDLKNENSDNTERKLTKEELTALCRRAKKHAQKFGEYMRMGKLYKRCNNDTNIKYNVNGDMYS